MFASVVPDVNSGAIGATAPSRSRLRSERYTSKPEPQIDGHFTHSGGGRCQTVIGGAQNRAPISNGYVVEQVLRLELQVGTAPLADAEDAPQRAIQRERGWSRDGVPSRIAPVPGKRGGERRGIEQQPGGFHRQAGGVGPQRIAHRSSAHLGAVAAYGRRERVSRADTHVAADGPIFHQGALPAIHQRASTLAHAGAVLELQGQIVAGIETGESGRARWRGRGGISV